ALVFELLGYCRRCSIVCLKHNLQNLRVGEAESDAGRGSSLRKVFPPVALKGYGDQNAIGGRINFSAWSRGVALIVELKRPSRFNQQNFPAASLDYSERIRAVIDF